MKKTGKRKTKASVKKCEAPVLNRSLVLFFVFILAFFLRAIFVSEWESLPYGKVPLLDAAAYDNWAKSIADGNLFRATAFYQSPLYPYLLAIIYRLLGHDYLFAGLLNALLGAGAVTFLSACSLRVFGAGAALATGLLAAFYQPMIFYAVPLMKESAGLFFLSAFLFFALRAFDANRLRDYVFSGLFFGLSALTRGNLLFLLPAFLFVAYLRHQEKVLGKCAAFAGVFFLCFVPSALHNYAASGDFIPVNYADGFNLYIGNHDSADGTSSYPPEVSTNPLQEEIDTTKIAREKTGQNLTPAGVSLFWRNRALDFMSNNPAKELTLVKNKFLAFWSNEEAFDNHNISFIRNNFDTILRASLPWFGVLSCLAAFTVVAAWKDKKKEVAALSVFILVYMVSLLLFYVTDRYRLPVVVFLLPLAGAAVPRIIKLIELKEHRRLIAGFFAMAIFIILALVPLPRGAVSPPAFNWGLLTIMYADSGRNREAIDALGKALALSPQDTGFLAIDKGAQANEKLGRLAAAVRLYNLAIKLFPDKSGARYYYGLMKENYGDLNGALSEYQKAVEIGPTDANSYYALGRVYEKLGDTERAAEIMKKMKSF